MPVGFMALLLGVALLFLGRPTSSAVLYSGYSVASSGSLSLEVSVDPPVGLPGDTLRMTVRVSNGDIQTQSPSVLLRLPRHLSTDIFALPPGATFNLQENRIDWLPSVPPSGVIEFSVNLLVQSTDVLIPEQAVESLLRYQGQERQASAPLWIGIPPLIGNVLPLNQVSVGQPIRLQAEVAGPSPLKTVWDLGDGRRLELDEPEVVFPAAGIYDIVLEASNPGGLVSRHASLTVLPAPVAAFRPDDDTPAINQPVTFLSTSGGQPPLRVSWDFGDGTTSLGEQQPIHAYRQGGTYRVRLTVENDFGRSEAVWDVAVGVGPVADMVIADRTVVGSPLVGQAFGDESVTRFSWDMGDGRSHEGATISHVYRRPGDYYVTMTADNGFGRTQAGRWVRVDAGTTTLFLPMTAHQEGSAPAALSADVSGVAELDPAVTSLEKTFTLDVLSFPQETSPAEQLFAYVNAARAQFQLPPLAYGYELSTAAQTHALDKSHFPDNPHSGSDGTTAAERLLRGGYRGGYAGEATAWGFADPRLAVEFWVNSESHRPLILSRVATDLGVGYVEDFGTTNVWHWTAEFGVSYGAPARAVLRALLPLGGYSALDTEIVNYNWMWPLPPAAGERFTVYLVANNRLLPVGTVSQPVYGSRYVLSVDSRAISSLLTSAGSYEWLVRLEDNRGSVIAESERRSIAFAADPAAPGPTPSPTVGIVTATPAAPSPTPSPTSPVELPTTVPPGNEPPPVIVTATPQPMPTPQPSLTPSP